MIVKLKRLFLKKILAKKNMSQNAFARKIQISSAYISQLFSGERNPSPEVRKSILIALNETQKLKNLKEYEFDDLFVIQGR